MNGKTKILLCAPETFSVLWNLSNWDKVKQNVKPLQCSIAKVINIAGYPAKAGYLMGCLSRVRWKSHARFLGGKGGAILPTYPTSGLQNPAIIPGWTKSIVKSELCTYRRFFYFLILLCVRFGHLCYTTFGWKLFRCVANINEWW